ncbi:MAG: DUF305 domain-containing protein [Acidobacteriota bacterium]
MKIAPVPIIATLIVAVGLASSCGTGGNDTGASAEAAAANAATEATGEAAQAPVLVQPGAPGEPSRTISREEATDLSGVQATPADVQFMQGMIHHHAQALDMTALVPERTGREDLKLLALRIDLSQQDEIRMMQEWLAARGEDAPAVHDHDMPGMPLMPGMLTPEQMDELAAARGEEFDRLFLEGMIRHHEGALVMVDELYATPGAGQESVISAFTAEVVADQRAEIGRMNAMRNAMIKEPRQ